MDYETIIFKREGPVGVLTLNRPERINAINMAMADELGSFFKERLSDLETRVIVITGAGKGFCSGVDLKDTLVLSQGQDYTPKTIYEFQSRFSSIILFMRRCPQPIIGAVNGACVGAGLSIAMACDVRFCAPEARFCAGYINIGVGGADMGSSWLFTRTVGLGNAARYLLTGDFFDAEEAMRIGFVQAILTKDRLMEEALKMADNMAGKSPLGLRLTKEALDSNAAAATLEDAVRLEDRSQALCLAEMAAAAAKKG